MKPIGKQMFLSVTLVFLASLASVAQAAWWSKALTCNGDRAVVDVDLGERRHLQLVIHDANIGRFFTSKGLFPEYLVYDGRLHMFKPDDGGVIVPSEIGNGIFNSSQLQSFQSPVSYSGHYFRVYRTGRGLKVEMRTAAGGGECLGNFDSIGNCTGDLSPIIQDQEVANWYFDDCQEVNLPN